mmetsp:Transcript_12968/g.27265  ORF Transcript_12968/g.27265 Transcript_12968/m.27265 type:complete len:227 (-) Transcript_12968:23-703(-)
MFVNRRCSPIAFLRRFSVLLSFRSHGTGIPTQRQRLQQGRVLDRLSQPFDGLRSKLSRRHLLLPPAQGISRPFPSIAAAAGQGFEMKGRRPTSLGAIQRLQEEIDVRCQNGRRDIGHVYGTVGVFSPLAGGGSIRRISGGIRSLVLAAMEQLLLDVAVVTEAGEAARAVGGVLGVVFLGGAAEGVGGEEGGVEVDSEGGWRGGGCGRCGCHGCRRGVWIVFRESGG